MSNAFEAGLSSSELLHRVRLNLTEDQDRLPFTPGSGAYLGSIQGDTLLFRLARRPFLSPSLSACFDDSGSNARVTFRARTAWGDWGLWIFAGGFAALCLPLLHNALLASPAVPVAREIENAVLLHDFKLVAFAWMVLTALLVLAGMSHFARCQSEFLQLLQRLAVDSDGRFLSPKDSASQTATQTLVQGHEITVTTPLPISEVSRNLQLCFEPEAGFFRHSFQGGVSGHSFAFCDPSILSGKNAVPHQFEGNLQKQPDGTKIYCRLEASAFASGFPWKSSLLTGCLCAPLLMLPGKHSAGLSAVWALAVGLMGAFSLAGLTRYLAQAKLKELQSEARRLLTHCAAQKA